MAGGWQVGDSSELGSEMAIVNALYPRVWVKVPAVWSFVSMKTGSKYMEGKGRRTGCAGPSCSSQGLVSRPPALGDLRVSIFPFTFRAYKSEALADPTGVQSQNIQSLHSEL